VSAGDIAQQAGKTNQNRWVGWGDGFRTLSKAWMSGVAVLGQSIAD
jgi:hypothetical protein